MAWRIHSWSEKDGRGEVVSPHFGPWPFGPAENTQGTTDFRCGEEVFVELDGAPDAYVVRTVSPARERQPPGTELPDLAEANDRDLRLDRRSDDELAFWVGNCCEWCSPSAPHLVFRGVTSFVGWDEDAPDFDPVCPLFRRASSDEARALELHVPDGSTAYCIVTRHGTGRDGPRVFIVARSADFGRPERTAPLPR
ncbi:MAG: hypothetical protein M3Y87_27325 [Myxococcota bacterium]|nr:hypothetical protein [Myxococcota bacterium]